MEKPDFPVPAATYRLAWLNGPRSGTSAELTIEGDSWSLANGATLHDVTHLPCRSARYTPTDPDASPGNAKMSDFPVTPGAVMPSVPGCSKSDYAVLFITGIEM